MSNLYMKINVLAGSDVQKTIAEAHRLAWIVHIPIEFEFNGIDVYVNENMSVENIVKRYHDDRGIQRNIDKEKRGNDKTLSNMACSKPIKTHYSVS